MNSFSLYTAIQDNIALNAKQKEALLKMVGYRCRATTIAKLARRIEHITLQKQCLDYYGVINRVRIEGNNVVYHTGQSYTNEIRLIRKALLS